MIKVVSIEQMQAIENAAAEGGTSFETMFDRVALAVANHITARLVDTSEPRVAILVGSGNNGGDGLVTAKRLAETTDIDVGVYLATNRDEDEQLEALQETDVFIARAEDDQQYRVLKNMVANAHIVVDAVFGIGVRLPLEGNITKVLRHAHQALTPPRIAPPEGEHIHPDASTPASTHRPHVLALDCPSGINCDTGEIDKHTLPADETITFIAVKQGLLMAPAAASVGQLSVATIGISDDLDELEAISLNYTDASAARDLLPDRADFSHKGTFGKAMVVAGSVNYTGAAGLASQAAYRAGAGLVTVAAPSPVVGSLATQTLETTWVMLPHDMGVISEHAADVLLKELKGYQALLLGPGIGTEDTTKNMLLKLFEATDTTPRRPTRKIGFAGVRKQDDTPTNNGDEAVSQLPPLVLDADALNLLATVEDWWELLPPNTVITPHPGEMARLCDMETADVQAQRLTLAQEKAANWNVIVLLKGAHSVIAAPDGRTSVLPFKTAALATAGTGDVLAGVIVSLLAQGVEPYEAAVLGGYLHGSAGKLAGQASANPYSPIASDVLNQLGGVLGALS